LNAKDSGAARSSSLDFFSRFRRESRAKESRTTEELPGLQGPLTAREALQVVLPRLPWTDQDLRLVFIGSGEDVNHEGRATLWEYFFEFPRRRARANFMVQPCDTGSEEPETWCVDIHVKKFGERFGPPRPPLPLEFQDSDAAVRALGEQGADWITGDTHMTLSTHVLPDGEIVWRTHCWDVEYRTPFAGH
jgi:hypothetical protein